jgi:hypothetical protein
MVFAVSSAILVGTADEECFVATAFDNQETHMKARTAPALIVLLIFSAWIVGQGQVRRAPAREPKLDFELSPYGTLLKLQVNDKPYGERPPGEGYAIGYRVGADERFVYAFSDQATDLSPGGPQTQSPNSRVATTNDGVWRITSHFSWDNQSGMVTIRRDIENVSSKHAELLSLKCQIGNNLAGVEVEALLPNTSLKAPVPLPINASLSRPTANCGKPPCPKGCGCSSCPICTKPLINAAYSTPSVLFRPENEGRVEISTPILGHSLRPDQLKRSFDLTLYWRTGREFVPTNVPPRNIVSIMEQVRLRR